MNTPEQTVLIGIALGSSTASVAFLLPGKNGQLAPVDGWPGSENVKSLTVPIRMRYKALRNWGDIDWGCAINLEDEDHQKAILWRVGQELGSKVDVAIIEELKTGKDGQKHGSQCESLNDGGFYTTAKNLMSSFLSAIRPHIERKIGLTFGNEILQNAQYEVCITVPPWWTHSQRTGYALHLKRVYPRLRLVCEATACLNYHISKNKRHKFEPQASYAHCSVEEEITTLAIYTVLQTSPELILNAQTCNILTLGCLDFSSRFVQLIEKRLSDFLASAAHDAANVHLELNKIKSGFVKFLPKIDGTRGYTFRLPWAVPDSVTSSIIDSQMTIDGSDLRSFVFDPLLSKLAEEVVITTPNSQPCQVLLSGILSECPYVSKFMENYSLGLVSKRLTILKPTDGLTSRSRGAALCLDSAQNKSSLIPLPPFETAQVLSVRNGNVEIRDGDGKAERQTQINDIHETQAHHKALAAANIDDGTRKWHMARLAVNSGDKHSARILYDASKSTNPGGEAILRWAVKEGHLRLLQTVLEFGADINTTADEGWSLLHTASYCGHIEIIHFLLEKGLKIDQQGPMDRTALHQATLGNSPRAVSVLIRRGADPMLTDEYGSTALHLACESGSFETTYDLFQVTDVRVKNKAGQTALAVAIAYNHQEIVSTLLLKEMELGNGQDTTFYTAAAEGDYDLVKTLIDLGDHQATHYLVNMTATDGEGPIHAATENNHEDVVQLLLDSGADIESKNVNGITPLQKAAACRHMFMLKKLLELGANVNATASNGWNALLDLVYEQEVAGVQILIEASADLSVRLSTTTGSTALHIAAVSGNNDLVRMLVKAGLNVDVVNNYGASPLQAAAQHLNISTVALLLELGAKVNFRDGELESALHTAARVNNPSILRLLIDKGAIVDARSACKQTPLMVAIQNGQETNARLLLGEGADLFAVDEDGHGCLHIAADSENLSLTRFLLSINARLEARSSNGRTPLIYAAFRGRESLVRLLLDEGANVHAKTKLNSNALHFAVSKGFLGTAEALLKGGAKPNTLNGDNLSPLQLAAEGGFVHLAGLLLDYGAKVDACEDLTWTALMIATRNCDIDLARILIQRGANPKARTKKEGLNLLHIAARERSTEMTRYFLDLGLDPEEKNADGFTARSLAYGALANLYLERGASPLTVNGATMQSLSPAQKNAKRPMFKLVAGRWKRKTTD